MGGGARTEEAPGQLGGAAEIGEPWALREGDELDRRALSLAHALYEGDSRPKG